MTRLTIPIYARHHDVSYSPPRDRLSRVLRLMNVERRRSLGGLDRTESAATSARISHELHTQIPSAPSPSNQGAPPTIIVAVASPLSPPQHCPILGHLASSHTVWRLRPRKSFLILLYEAEVGTDVLRYDGSRGLQTRPSAPPAQVASSRRPDARL